MFLHIAKTGGTWVRAALKQSGVPWTDCGNQHAAYEESLHICPGDYQRFTIIRNPFTWYQSYWSMKYVQGWDYAWHFADCITDDFNEFVTLVVKNHPGFLSNLYKDYLPEGSGVHVLRNETLKTDLCNFLEGVGETFDRTKLLSTIRANVSFGLSRVAARAKYDSEPLEMVRQSEAKILTEYYGGK